MRLSQLSISKIFVSPLQSFPAHLYKPTTQQPKVKFNSTFNNIQQQTVNLTWCRSLQICCAKTCQPEEDEDFMNKRAKKIETTTPIARRTRASDKASYISMPIPASRDSSNHSIAGDSESEEAEDYQIPVEEDKQRSPPEQSPLPATMAQS